MNTTMMITLLSSCMLLSSPQHSPSTQAEPDRPDPPVAFITSERVVYGHGHPIDLTFSIAVPDVEDGRVLPDFEILNEVGEAVKSREVDGRHFWEAPGKAIDGVERQGTVPAGRQHTETIADLHEWYELDTPGTYRVTFDGEWQLPASGAARRGEVESHPVTSNTLVIRIARPPSEDEPEGEPTEGHIIPLEEIWALDMPGTKPMQIGMQQVDPPVFWAPEGRYVAEIRREIAKAERLRQPAPRVFVVRGTGLEALEEAHAVLLGKREARSRIRRNEQASLCFTTHSFGDPAYIRKVADHGSLVDITYELIGLHSMDITWHFALIPIQFEEAGMVHIEPKPVVWERRASPRYAEFIRQRMPRSSVIEVVE